MTQVKGSQEAWMTGYGSGYGDGYGYGYGYGEEKE